MTARDQGGTQGDWPLCACDAGCDELAADLETRLCTECKQHDDCVAAPSPATEGREGGEVEALAEAFNHHEPDQGDCEDELVCSNPQHLARVVLAAGYRSPAEVERLVTQAREEAWDEGYNMGDPYQRRGNPGEGKQANPYRARAAGVRGEEGATTVRRFIDKLPNDRFTEREIERLREWADEVGA